MFNNIFKGKRILITGDTGFKGSWLATWLLELGAEVYGYALPPLRKEDNYNVSALSSRFKHTDGDVRDFDSMLRVFKETKPDIAFHLAAQALVLPSYKEPRETFETNLMGTVNFFEAVRLTDSVKVAVNITSDKCYQNNEWVWGYRENDPMGGNDPYSASKGCSELITNAYLLSFFNKNNVQSIATARAGNVIGAGDWAEYRIIPDYFRALKKSKSLYIRNPNATRPWQHVLEPLSGYLHLASMLYSEGDKYKSGWNFGPKDSMNYSVGELIKTIKKFETKGSYKFEGNNKKPHEANLLKLDISKAVKYLKWKPVLAFEKTVELTTTGYLNDIENKPAFENRLETINIYSQEAKKLNLSWTIA
jgi:CDP-glucose 4,6-dehydratase